MPSWSAILFPDLFNLLSKPLNIFKHVPLGQTYFLPFLLTHSLIFQSHSSLKLLAFGSLSLSVTSPVIILGDFHHHVGGLLNHLFSQNLNLFTWNDVFNQSSSVTYSRSSTLDLIIILNTSKSWFREFCWQSCLAFQHNYPGTLITTFLCPIGNFIQPISLASFSFISFISSWARQSSVLRPFLAYNLNILSPFSL